MDPRLEIYSHVGADGILHIEGLLDMKDQDVTVTVSRSEQANDTGSQFNLEQYAAQATGKAITDNIKAIGRSCSALNLLGDHSPWRDYRVQRYRPSWVGFLVAIDSSALVTILFEEDEADVFAELISHRIHNRSFMRGFPH